MFKRCLFVYSMEVTLIDAYHKLGLEADATYLCKIF